jgi:hypothetical protein
MILQLTLAELVLILKLHIVHLGGYCIKNKITVLATGFTNKLTLLHVA